MWSTRCVAACVALLPILASAQPNACPGFIGKKTNRLVNARLFDGPVADMAELVPDQEGGGTWSVDGYATTGRPLTLLCEYKGGQTAEVVIAHPVGKCHFRGKKQRAAWCDQ